MGPLLLLAIVEDLLLPGLEVAGVRPGCPKGNLAQNSSIINTRLLTNSLCLPDHLICLIRIDQAERFA